jgi:hypothetical protein
MSNSFKIVPQEDKEPIIQMFSKDLTLTPKKILTGGHNADLPFLSNPLLINKDRIAKLKKVASTQVFGALPKLDIPIQYAPLVEARYFEKLRKAEHTSSKLVLPSSCQSIMQLVSPFIRVTKIDQEGIIMVTQNPFQSQLALQSDLWVIDVSIFITYCILHF